MAQEEGRVSPEFECAMLSHVPGVSLREFNRLLGLNLKLTSGNLIMTQQTGNCLDPGGQP
jgi:hypothetical protein